MANEDTNMAIAIKAQVPAELVRTDLLSCLYFMIDTLHDLLHLDGVVRVVFGYSFQELLHEDVVDFPAAHALEGQVQTGSRLFGRERIQFGSFGDKVRQEGGGVRVDLRLPERHVTPADHAQILHQIAVEVLAELEKEFLLFLAGGCHIPASEFGDFCIAETRLVIYFPGSGVMACG